MAGRFSVETIFTAVDRLSQPVSRMQRNLQNFSRAGNAQFTSINKSIDRVNSNMGAMARTTARYGAVALAGVSGGLLGVVKSASRVEDSIAAFTPILKGADNATKAVRDLQAAAAETPFRFQDLSDASRTLLGFKAVTQEDLIPTLRMLGDTAGGNSERLKGIALAFGQIKAAGRADMRDLLQLINNGVPIVGALADQLGVSTVMVREMTSQGRITADVIEQTFRTMTSEQGMFYRGMAIASKTQSGLFSTLQDNIMNTAATIGDQFLPITKRYTLQMIEATGKVREWVGQNKELIGLKVEKTVDFIVRNIKNFADVLEGTLRLLALWLSITIAVKVATLAWNAVLLATKIATIAYNVVLAITNGLLMRQAFLYRAGTVAMMLWSAGFVAGKVVMLAFAGAMKIVNGVMYLWAAAMAIGLSPIYLVIAAVAALIAIGFLLYKKWQPIKEFFVGIFDGVAEKITSVIDAIKKIVGLVTGPIGKLLGGSSKIVQDFRASFGGSNESDKPGTNAQPYPNMVTPSDIIGKSIEERTNFVEMTVKDETGRVEMPNLSKLGINMKLQQSGAF